MLLLRHADALTDARLTARKPPAGSGVIPSPGPHHPRLGRFRFRRGGTGGRQTAIVGWHGLARAVRNGACGQGPPKRLARGKIQHDQARVQGSQVVGALIEYVRLTPVRQGLCKSTVDWRSSSARWYASEGAAVDADLRRIHALPPELFQPCR